MRILMAEARHMESHIQMTSMHAWMGIAEQGRIHGKADGGRSSDHAATQSAGCFEALGRQTLVS